MMCPHCKEARSNLHHCSYTPKCLWCGARLIQAIGGLSIPASQASQRKRAVLNDWVAWGHSEKTIRTLVQGERAIGPDAPKASEAPNPTKRR